MDVKTFEYVIFGFMLLLVLALYKKRKKVTIVIDEEKQKCESPIERKVYDLLFYNGYYPTTQVRVGIYRIDIALSSHKIALECDGKDFHTSLIDKARDRRKDAYLRSNGWVVIRFTGSRINKDLNGILNQINNVIIR